MFRLCGVLLLAALVQGSPATGDRLLTPYNYHEEVGIPQAKLIKDAEEQMKYQRIVGGSLAEISDIPYQVGLLVSLVSGAVSVCGAALVSNTRLLTAAHCWADGSQQARHFTAVLGSRTLYSGGTRINTNTVEVHANWNPWTLSNDIAVVTIPWVAYSNSIRNVALPAGSSTYERVNAMASGYGRSTNDDVISSSATLRYVWSPVLSTTACQRHYGASVTSSHVCISGNHAVGTCQGDTGGPLVVETGSNFQKVLIGVSAFGFGHTSSCQAGLPSVFTRVTTYMTWINARL
ncbi:collagenase isoform X1 [Plutella xylostella]|uniref:collagenase isoform X1 n=1 Tax=Plutella xylostella TaxID=51655 RepID=UPI0020329766|nr:collagenase isoform X1 [Plutella xylostella]